ncbi:PilT/PilU family type 4a pilus ATPase [Flavobacteriaceae bacterium]|nr:PilT/PilU family type 4a pilus ATPase [Flavobacteriaceae bacterium]
MATEIHTLLIDPFLKKLAKYAIEKDASDLHISTNNFVFIRVNGALVKINSVPESSAELVKKIFNSITTDEQKDVFEKNKECDLSVSIANNIRIRANAFLTKNGVSISIRFVPVKKAKTLEELTVPEVIRENICNLKKGLVLVTGPTGSGKTTTISAIIDHLNSHYNYHIITIENPVEFIHKSQKSLIQQREVGVSSSGFDSSVKAALREDPDVIMIGEMRSLETIRAALHAAETGHLVFGTLHTNSASNTISRIVNAFPSDEYGAVRSLLSEVLKGVISQRLLPNKVSGRCAAFEIMVSTNAISNLILEGKISKINSMIEIGQKKGMILMQQSIKKLIAQEMVDTEEAEKILRSYDKNTT